MKTARTRLALLFAALTTANLLAQPALAPDPKFQVRLATPVEADAWNWLVQSDGKIVISGGFEFIRGTSTWGMARLHPDGTVDKSFKPEIDAMCVGLLAGLQSGDRILFSGVLGGTNRLHRLNAQGRLDPTFNAPASLLQHEDVIGVVTILPDDGLIGYRARYNRVANRTEAELFRLKPDGDIDPTFALRVSAPEQPNYLYYVGCPKGGSGPPYHRYGGGLVNAVTLLPDGKFLIGGSFTTVSGKPRQSLARLNADGTLDESFQSPLSKSTVSSAQVWRIAVQGDGKILVGGELVSAEGCGVLRLLPNGTVDPNFNSMLPQVPGKQICLALLGGEPGGNTLIAAYLRQHGTTLVERIVELRSDGTLAGDDRFDPVALSGGDYLRPGPTFRILPDGKILIRRSGPEWRSWYTSDLVRLNADGTADSTFAPVVPEVSGGEVHILTRSGDKLILNGLFSCVNGHLSPRLARLNADGTVDTSFVADPATPDLFQTWGDSGLNLGSILPLRDGKLLVHSPCCSLVRLNADGRMDNSFNVTIEVGAPSGSPFPWPTQRQRPPLGVQSDGRVLVQKPDDGGLVRLGLDGTVDASFAPVFTSGGIFDPPQPFTAIVVQSDDRIVVAGSFTNVNGVARQGLAKLNADGTLDLTFDAGTPFGAPDQPDRPGGFVRALAVDGQGRVLVGGGFSRWLGTILEQAGIVRLKPDGSFDHSFLTELADSFTDPSLGPLLFQSDGSVVIPDQFGSPHVQQDARMGLVFAGSGSLGRSQFIPVIRQPRWAPGLRFTVKLGVLPGVPHRIETSTDLVNWRTVTTVTSATENLPFSDPEAATAPRRFYRAVLEDP